MATEQDHNHFKIPPERKLERKETMEQLCNAQLINSLDLTGDGIFNGLDLAIAPLWLGLMWLMFWVLPKQTLIKRG